MNRTGEQTTDEHSWQHGCTEYFISIKSKLVRAKNSSPTTTNTPKKLKNNLTTTVKKQHKAVKRHAKRNFHTIVPIGVFVIVIGLLISSKYFSTAEMTGESFSARIFDQETTISVDEVTSAKVARIVAQDANIIVAENVDNLASYVEAKVDLSISEEAFVAKPQIVETKTRTAEDILEYVAKEGDTVTSISEKFGITEDTLRWANDLTGSLVASGKKLRILPVTGLLYEVKEGDTAAKLAEKYSSNADDIISFNDAEVNGLKVGKEIVIPGGEKPAPPPVVTFASFSSVPTYTGPTATSTPTYGGNTYVWGNCTWYASNRRAELGRPIPNLLGNAISWPSSARAYGLTVNNTPAVGAVMAQPIYILGHVAIVERINPDGSVLISEMNYNWALGVYNERIIPAAEAAGYQYIH